MSRTALTAALFAACLLIGAAATLWLSATIVRLDREQRDYQDMAALEENVRLALWRMDSALGPFIAAESMRPYNLYTAFYEASEAVDPTSNGYFRETVLLPSPLLTYDSPYVKLHFQLDASGLVSSPQVPTEAQRNLADTNYLEPGTLNDAMARLESLHPLLDFNDLLTRLKEPVGSAPPDTTAATGTLSATVRQTTSNRSELFVRQNQAREQQIVPSFKIVAKDPNALWSTNNGAEWKEDPIVPLWVGEELFLARTVRSDQVVRIQGCWLDWPTVQDWLLGLCDDLLPGATLDSAVGNSDVSDFPGRQLASLPVRLVPGPQAPTAYYDPSPLRRSLFFAVGGIAAATLAITLLLWGALALSERRARFVSAVTHELRTPLTTFRLYTEMLVGGMVPEGEKRQHYLETLYAESGRLSHLVENVLAYARLERRANVGELEKMPLAAAIAGMEERLSQRAKQADMTLTLEEEADGATLRLDPTILEQILYNLVDNACKYAATADDRRIHLITNVDEARVFIRVRDHGPGIPARDRRRIFRPFTKSVHEAARSAPGVGLGLGLSRRLARSLGGALTLESGVDGATFLLTLLRQP